MAILVQVPLQEQENKKAGYASLFIFLEKQTFGGFKSAQSAV